MKHLSFGVIFAALVATVFISCRKGEKGDAGPAGTAGQLPYKSGSVTGTLTGTSAQTDASFTENLDFQYFKTPEDNRHAIISGEGTEDTYVITRYDSIGSSYIKFEFSVEYYDGNQDGVDEPYIYNPYVTIVSNKKAATGNGVFYFATTSSYYNPFDVSSVYLSSYSSGGNSNITIDNLTINANTGAIKFDYSLELNYYNNSSANNAYLDGTVNATPYDVSYRESAQ